MSERIEIPFVGPAYNGRSRNVNSQRCVNWYYQKNLPGSLSPASLYPTPGLEEWVDLGTAAEVRGLWPKGDELYAVSGSDFFSVDTDGNATDRGDLLTIDNPVSMANNTTQVIIVDGPNGYTYTPATTTFAQIVDAGFPGAETVTFIDQYFVVNPPDSQAFYISALNDGMLWDATDLASAEGAPDNLVGVIADHRRLWLIGEESIELWRNTGAAAFPFAKIDGAFIEAGCVSKNSIAKGDNAVFWLGRNQYGQDEVFRAFSHETRIISNSAIEWQLAQYTTSNAIGFVYRQEGRTFYELTFPTDGKTWVFDSTAENPEDGWHERSSRITTESGITDGRHRINCHAFFNGDHIVGDFTNGKLYKMKTDVYAEDGEEIVRRRQAPIIHESQNTLFFSEAQIMFQPGVGLTVGQGSDPKAYLNYSNDGGNTWSNKREMSIGKIGEYKNRAKLNRLGSGRNRVFGIEISDPVNATIISAYARAAVGRS